MKIERKEGFVPVVITLETREEFNVVKAIIGGTNYGQISNKTGNPNSKLIIDNLYHRLKEIS